MALLVGYAGKDKFSNAMLKNTAFLVDWEETSQGSEAVDLIECPFISAPALPNGVIFATLERRNPFATSLIMSTRPYLDCPLAPRTAYTLGNEGCILVYFWWAVACEGEGY